MNCARVNCAHDGPDVWVRIAGTCVGPRASWACRAASSWTLAAQDQDRRASSPPAGAEMAPVRDRMGRVVTPATICLTAIGAAVAERPV